MDRPTIARRPSSGGRCAEVVNILDGYHFRRSRKMVNEHFLYEFEHNKDGKEDGFNQYVCFSDDYGWVKTTDSKCDISCGISAFFPEDSKCLENVKASAHLWNPVNGNWDSIDALYNCRGGKCSGSPRAITEVDECANGSDSCGANTHCVDKTEGYSCNCNAGYMKDSESDAACFDIDECARGRCPTGQCVNTDGSYECSASACQNHDEYNTVPLSQAPTAPNRTGRSADGVDDGLLANDVAFERNMAMEYTKRGAHLPQDRIDNAPFKKPGKRAVSGDGNLWTNNWDGTHYQVGYFFDGSYPADWKAPVRDSLAEFQTATCIKMIETTEGDSKFANKIRVHRGGGCWSYVSRIGWSVQDLSLDSGCTNGYIPQHEFIHALGIWHEQQRHDWNTAINVNKNKYNCGDSMWFANWDPAVMSSWLDLGSPYDFDSIMHYNGNVCGNGLLTYKTGTDLHSAGDSVIPNHSGRLGAQDSKQLNEFYSCPTQAVYPCASSSHEARDMYLANRRCDGHDDCEDGSDEQNCNDWGSCSETVEVFGADFSMKSVVNGHYMYADANNRHICFVASDLIGNGGWVLLLDDGAPDCDTSCGAQYYTAHETSLPCLTGNVFNKWSSGNWSPPSDEERDTFTVMDKADIWDTWSQWTDCSATCSGGMRNRERDCKESGGCDGTDKQQQEGECNTQDCKACRSGLAGRSSGRSPAAMPQPPPRL